MDVAAFTQIISTVGFPIACVIAMFWLWNQEREAAGLDITMVEDTSAAIKAAVDAEPAQIIDENPAETAAQ